MSFVKNFQNFVFQEKLFGRGDKIVVGVSGGPDSTCLAVTLNKLREKYDMDLLLVHINYGLRGEDSEEDERFVRELADKLSLKLKVIKYKATPVKPPLKRGAATPQFNGARGNLEQQMREFRYKKFEEIRRREKYDLIVVGHTKDDQAETVLMNLIRGTGLKGLGAMSARRGKIIRPLLAFEKKEIIDFLEKFGWSYRLDKSNLDEKLTRNKIRLKLIPQLEKDYNPQIKNRLADLARQLQGINLLVEQIAEKTYNEVAGKNGKKVFFKLPELNRLSSPLRNLMFRKAVSELKGDVRNISFAHLFEFEKMIESEKAKNQKFTLGSIVIKKRGNNLEFEIEN